MSRMWDRAPAPKPCEKTRDPGGSSGDGATERRRHPRQRILWAGALAADNAEVECVVEDISPGGARLCVEGGPAGPEPLALIVPGIGRFSGTIAWRDAARLGLAFLDRPEIVSRVVGLPS